MAFFTPEQKAALGPLLPIGTFLVSAAFGVAINTLAGGPVVPVISEFAGIIVGAVAGLVVYKNLSK